MPTNMANVNKSKQQQENPLKCEICDNKFKSNNGLKNHLNLAHKFMEEQQCNICQSVFKLQRQLNSHVKIVHENIKYHKAESLKKHINSVHNSQKDHKCDSCGKASSSAGDLK